MCSVLCSCMWTKLRESNSSFSVINYQSTGVALLSFVVSTVSIYIYVKMIFAPLRLYKTPLDYYGET